MKQFGLEKKVSGAQHGRNPWKVDYHLHENGHKLENWWEGFCNLVSRTTMKHRIKREIERELQDNKK